MLLPQPSGPPRCRGWAERVTWPWGQPAPAESTAPAFQSLGLPLGEAENKQTRQRRAGLLTYCRLVLITQECLVRGVLLFFLRLAPPSLFLPPKPREADGWCCWRGPGHAPRAHGAFVAQGWEGAGAGTGCCWGPRAGLGGGRLGDPGWKRAAMLGSAPAVGAAGTLVTGASPGSWSCAWSLGGGAGSRGEPGLSITRGDQLRDFSIGMLTPRGCK